MNPDFFNASSLPSEEQDIVMQASSLPSLGCDLQSHPKQNTIATKEQILHYLQDDTKTPSLSVPSVFSVVKNKKSRLRLCTFA